MALLGIENQCNKLQRSAANAFNGVTTAAGIVSAISGLKLHTDPIVTVQGPSRENVEGLGLSLMDMITYGASRLQNNFGKDAAFAVQLLLFAQVLELRRPLTASESFFRFNTDVALFSDVDIPLSVCVL